MEDSSPALGIINEKIEGKIGPSASSATARPSIQQDCNPRFQPFPLMKLPLEVREMVYRQHLVLPYTICASGSVWRGAKMSVRLRAECGVHDPSHYVFEPFDQYLCELWATSRAIYQESVPVFFRNNYFHFSNLNFLLRFLSCIGIEARRSIASISFEYCGAAPAKAFKLLKECIALRRLTIEFGIYTSGLVPITYGSLTGIEVSLMRLRGLGELLKIRGIEYFELVVPENLGFSGLYSDIIALENSLQALKRPRTAVQLRRQERKDYPQKATRTVFGKANVTTRTEAKVKDLS